MIRIQAGEIGVTRGVALPIFNPKFLTSKKEAIYAVASYLYPLSKSISSVDTRLYNIIKEGLLVFDSHLDFAEVESISRREDVNKEGVLPELAMTHIQYLDLIHEPYKAPSKMWSLFNLPKIRRGEDARQVIEKSSLIALISYGII